MSLLLKKFVDTFQKAISTEMEAMRRRLGPFEAPLGSGKALSFNRDEPGKFYTFQILKPNEKLTPQVECTLRYDQGEVLVTIVEINQAELTLRTERTITLNEGDYTLVIYPWFLYERLQDALVSLIDADDFFVSNALLLFGKGEPHQRPRPLQADHTALNASQQQAIQLCSDSNLAFVWGPPGTGKTTTLSHIVTELLKQGQRILITSTTNAAVDQALAQLAELPEMQPHLERGRLVRIGQTQAELFGAGLKEVVHRLNAEIQAELEALRNRLETAARQLKRCDQLLAKLEADIHPLQLDLFREVTSEALTARDLAPIFGERRISPFLRLPAKKQQQRVILRRQRLETIRALCRQKINQLSQELSQQEVGVVRQARVILATMTNMYMSNLLKNERFDAVIVEEAGMAILPTLFYCATLAREKLIMVGDPKQLPPIVQSRDDYVYRAMGRNIFEVAAQNESIEALIVMLDVQYRMHPVIGDLVSALFYEGKLRHGDNTGDKESLARKSPYPGSPLVVLDTTGQTTCVTQAGSFSRLNEKTAELCVELAMEAVRDGVDSVAVITPYAAQSRLIQRRLADYPGQTSQIECRTVHRFQGGERDVVILDTVDAAPLPPGVLLAGRFPGASSRNLINVSLSRARGKVVIICDVAYFNRNLSNEVIVNEMLRKALQVGHRVALV